MLGKRVVFKDDDGYIDYGVITQVFDEDTGQVEVEWEDEGPVFPSTEILGEGGVTLVDDEG